MTWLQGFFLSNGRLSRGVYFCRLAVLGVVCAAGGSLVIRLFGENTSALCSLIFLIGASVLSAQRLHDSGRSAWTLIALAVPILGPLWVILQLLRPGAPGSNRYGADPSLRDGYLTVDIRK